jgi:hypothetical protein
VVIQIIQLLKEGSLFAPLFLLTKNYEVDAVDGIIGSRADCIFCICESVAKI